MKDYFEFKNYDAYSQKEEPRISHEEVRMGKIELLMQDNQNKKALNSSFNASNTREPSGTRTPDNLIKSQVLYHLS